MYSSKALWPESTSQKRSSPAEIITTYIYVNRVATPLKGNIGKYVGRGCGGAVGGGGSIHGVSFRGLSICHRVWVLRELLYRCELDRVSCVVRFVSLVPVVR